MRILYIADGQNIHTRRWLNHFALRGHSIALLTDSPGTDYEPRIVQQVIGKKSGNKIAHYFHCVKQIKLFIRQWKPDIVHGHFISGYGYWAQMSGFHPLVLTAWGSDIYILPQTKMSSRVLTKKALQQADLITADSDDLIRSIQQLQPNTKVIKKIVIGIEGNVFKPTDQTSKFKQSLGYQDTILLLSNRRLEPIYRIDLILRGFQLAFQQNPALRLLILNDGSQRHALETLTRELNLSSAVTFAGDIPHQDLSRYLQAADIYLSIPQSDATAVSLLEAIGCGVPVIATDLPSNREWIQNSVNGVLLTTSHPPELAQAIHTIIANNSHYRESLLSHRQEFLQSADFQSQMEVMNQLYHSLLIS